MKKKAIITGISGQDGSYLSEYLLENNYEVYGIIRRNSIVEHQRNRIEKLDNVINLEYGDLLDNNSLNRILKSVMPDEIYNLAAQSHVRISFEIPHFTVQTNGIGVLNMLEAFRVICPSAKFYQASSSEMFGRSVDEDNCQRESTPFQPTSPYGCAKALAFNFTKHYRFAYSLFCSNGILFNHESPRRGSNFVTNKVVKTAVQIKLGMQDKLILGNMDSYRDWGHSRDYVRAMHMILNHSEADDFVISTGKTRSVRDLCKYVFNKLNLDMDKHIFQDEKYMRPEELKYLKGDSSKARKLLNWEPQISFEEMIDEMIDHWIEIFK